MSELAQNRDQSQSEVTTPGETWSSTYSKWADAEFTSDKEAVNALRDATKWVFGGIAIGAAGATAGPALTSLGSLGLGPRLMLAACAGIVGLLVLAWLLWIAMDVLTPMTYVMKDVLEGKVIRNSEVDEILERIERTFPNGTLPIRNLFQRFQSGAEAAQRGMITNEARKLLDVDGQILGVALSGFRFEHYRMKFLRLKHYLVGAMPMAALSFGVFAWAANPPKNDSWDVTPMVLDVDTTQSDTAVLRKLMSSPDCVTSRISVLILRERRTGSQDVVTMPSKGCAPIRLGLAHGKLFPAITDGQSDSQKAD
jgi:hypothetical protein